MKSTIVLNTIALNFTLFILVFSLKMLYNYIIIFKREDLSYENEKKETP